MNYYKLENQELVLIQKNIEDSTEYVVKNNLVNEVNMIFNSKDNIPIFMNYQFSFEFALSLLKKYFKTEQICIQEMIKNNHFYETDSKIYDLRGNCIEHHYEICDENIFLIKVICFDNDEKIKEIVEYEYDESGDTKIMRVFDNEGNLINKENFGLYD